MRAGTRHLLSVTARGKVGVGQGLEGGATVAVTAITPSSVSSSLRFHLPESERLIKINGCGRLNVGGGQKEQINRST